MNGLSVGAWDDFLDPDRLRLDIVEAFRASVLDEETEEPLRRGCLEAQAFENILTFSLFAINSSIPTNSVRGNCHNNI